MTYTICIGTISLIYFKWIIKENNQYIKGNNFYQNMGT